MNVDVLVKEYRAKEKLEKSKFKRLGLMKSSDVEVMLVELNNNLVNIEDGKIISLYYSLINSNIMIKLEGDKLSERLSKKYLNDIMIEMVKRFEYITIGEARKLFSAYGYDFSRQRLFQMYSDYRFLPVIVDGCVKLKKDLVIEEINDRNELIEILKDKDFITVKEMSKVTDISEHNLRYYIRSNKLKTVKIKNLVMISLDDIELEKYITKGSVLKGDLK